MDVPSPQHDYARSGDAAYCTDDPGPSRTPGGRNRSRWTAHFVVFLGSLIAGGVQAETLRIATYHTGLSGRGPGLILRDILRQEEEVTDTIAVIEAARPDILALQDIDYDGNQLAVAALAEVLGYPHYIALRPNTGRLTGLDLDGDGRTDGPRDAHGYGRFSGQGGMALLSRYPLGEMQDFSEMLWNDLADSNAPNVTPPEALSVLRLHTVGAWNVEVLTPNGPLHVLMSHATPPVFDGPEDRNGLRNADELRFWSLYLADTPPEHFAFMGTLNIDPQLGEGVRGPLLDLLSHPAVQDPVPGGPTADWDEPTPGDLRVDYVLPSRNLTVTDAGVLWPTEGAMAETVAAASDHRVVWVDVDF